MADKYIYAIGRRKTSVATLRLFEKAGGKSIVNSRPINEYFGSQFETDIIMNVFKVSSLDPKNFMFTVVTKGGGLKSQRDAVKLALARAIVKKYPEIKKTLKTQGLLTRDPRMVERKSRVLENQEKPNNTQNVKKII